MKHYLVFLFLFGLFPYAAQTQDASSEVSQPIPEADFTWQQKNSTLQFESRLPPLNQRAGAPEAFWSYFWLFGDGTFSREATPEHRYDQSGEYEVILLATGNYDTGKPPKKKKKKASAYADAGESAPYPHSIKEENRNLGIMAARDASPEEENVIVLSYHNHQPWVVSGRLHLFYNEARFSESHFEYQESHLYYEEEEEAPAYSLRSPPLKPAGPAVASTAPLLGLGELISPLGLAENERDQLLAEAETLYRDHKIWTFNGLSSGFTRNLFAGLQATPEMVEDTTVTIYMRAVLESNDGSILEVVDLEMPIVSSHDPNVQQVSDKSVAFRGVRHKNLKYKTRFQNTGKGPAEQIKITTTFKPKGVLKLEELNILDTYPEVPLCPEGGASYSCLDTAILEDQLIFTFRNVYLPGTNQEGVRDKDSTKGYVRYEILPDKKMKRRSFRGRAGIEFDNELPVFTNWARTRFKRIEPSPFAMAGYRTFPDSSNYDDFFLGAVVASAYKAYGWYLQPEIHTGLSGARESRFVLPDQVRSGVAQMQGSDFVVKTDTILKISGVRTVRRHTVELVPLHLRRNLNDFIGLGAGLTYQLMFERREETGIREIRILRQQCIDDGKGNLMCPRPPQQINETEQENFESARTVTLGNLGLFVDINIGMARAGPVLGLRNLYRLGRKPAYGLMVYGGWRF